MSIGTASINLESPIFSTIELASSMLFLLTSSFNESIISTFHFPPELQFFHTTAVIY
ncbi:hypothetical protein HMPREF9413_3295 [Paenibacillus sp. HGF7]|nr:hypothetical protein HMPREF9413_3295 [Paenibacillus sp. HGF7]